ncbi:hypothetical protein CLOSTMETH_02957 [[Clostridium] methylpentosum DSM 5476]|uniref:Uncharacterized protein n=1 Tax=[Clostridium] methylpentosum DSM 5476 TaxID=537013 RepID=C0EGG4_9FIRM|nr:hypothetical protein CLOSTMETH_02957 [[Clostridium] methylpentosum DSM 5476]MEE1493018.1 hypothetical protein [Massilioclostridium sp.]
MKSNLMDTWFFLIFLTGFFETNNSFLSGLEIASVNPFQLHPGSIAGMGHKKKIGQGRCSDGND